jgi:sec-independent protein translocase protein TatB
MFDIAWSELALIGAVALIVIGPKDLPKVMRVMGQWTRKARLLANEFQNNFDEMVRTAELDEVRRQVQAVNPAAVKEHVEKLIDPKGIEAALAIDPAAPAGPAAHTVAPEVAAEATPAAVAVPTPAVDAAAAATPDSPVPPVPSVESKP